MTRTLQHLCIGAHARTCADRHRQRYANVNLTLSLPRHSSDRFSKTFCPTTRKSRIFPCSVRHNAAPVFLRASNAALTSSRALALSLTRSRQNSLPKELYMQLLECSCQQEAVLESEEICMLQAKKAPREESRRRIIPEYSRWRVSLRVDIRNVSRPPRVYPWSREHFINGHERLPTYGGRLAYIYYTKII